MRDAPTAWRCRVIRRHARGLLCCEHPVRVSSAHPRCCPFCPFLSRCFPPAHPCIRDDPGRFRWLRRAGLGEPSPLRQISVWCISRQPRRLCLLTSAPTPRSTALIPSAVVLPCGRLLPCRPSESRSLARRWFSQRLSPLKDLCLNVSQLPAIALARPPLHPSGQPSRCRWPQRHRAHRRTDAFVRCQPTQNLVLPKVHEVLVADSALGIARTGRETRQMPPVVACLLRRRP